MDQKIDGQKSSIVSTIKLTLELSLIPTISLAKFRCFKKSKKERDLYIEVLSVFVKLIMARLLRVGLNFLSFVETERLKKRYDHIVKVKKFSSTKTWQSEK